MQDEQNSELKTWITDYRQYLVNDVVDKAQTLRPY